MVFRVVNELQGVSTFVCRDLFQQLELLRRLIARVVCLCKLLLVNELDRYFELRCLVLREDHFTEATLPKQAQRNVLREQVLALNGLVLANLQKAIVKVSIVIEEYVSLDASKECENKSLVVWLARLHLFLR